MTSEAARHAPTVRFPPPLDLYGTLIVAVLWGLANALLRRATSPWLSGDDAKTNLFTQVWQWGYQADNPPLFEWLTKLLHLATPSDLWSFLVLKYACVAAAMVFVHLSVRGIARRAGEGAADRAGFTAAASLVLLYPVGWSLHQAFTHSALLLAASAAFVWAALRVDEAPRAARFALLGLVAGLGLLSKYNFLLIALPLVLAAGLDPSRRRRFYRSGLLLALLIALVIAWPHLTWFRAQGAAYADTASVTLGLEGAHAARAASGVGALLAAGLTFLAPFGLLAAWRWRRVRPALAEPERFLMATTGVALAILLAGIVLIGVSEVSVRYLIPALLPAFVALASATIRGGGGPLLLRASGIVAALILMLRTIAALVPAPPFCDDCWDFVPYGTLTDRLAEVTPPGSVYLAREENTAGNLVQAFPDARVLSLNLIPAMNPTDGTRRPCYYVWSEDMTHGVPLFAVFRFAYDDPETVMVDAPWRHPLREAGFRRTVWGVTPLDEPRLYERFCVPGAPG